MKLYRLRYSEYDGCNGWTSWYGEDVYTSHEEASKHCRGGKYFRCSVEKFETKPKTSKEREAQP
jgi:hypothetical protein